MTIGKDEFLKICKYLYENEEYNRAIGTMAVTKDKKIYAKNLLTALKIEQSGFEYIQQ